MMEINRSARMLISCFYLMTKDVTECEYYGTISQNGKVIEMNHTEKGYFELDGGRLYYETAGEGEAMVLSHAGFLDSRMFDGIWEPLARQFRVTRYDMRGFGKSSPVTGPVCRRDDLARLMDHLGITNAHLVGCSMGGELSLDLALERPELVRSLTLVDSTPSGFAMQGEPPRYLFEMFDAVQNGDVDRASELQIRIWIDGQYREPQQVDKGLRKKALEMNRLPVEQKTFLITDMQPANPLTPPAVTRLETVKCPALVIAGSLDNPEVLRAADEMANRIPSAKKVIVDGCAHVPSYEQPEKFLSCLQDFLK
jgi:pimeloyl-ACP methyl ester carboxylesterase